MDNCPPYGYPLLSHPMEKEPVVITKKHFPYGYPLQVLFLCTKKIPNRQNKRIGIPFVCLARKVLHRDIVTKKDGLYNPSLSKLYRNNQLTVIIVQKKVRASQVALTDKKERKNYVIDGFYPTYHNYILSISY